MSADDHCTVMQYRDPITRERRTTVLCLKHSLDALSLLYAADIGCSSTNAGSLHSCDACRNEGDNR